ncbi:MAG: GGDEF domain-containing response regulator [Actinomycetota bacterium]
MAERVLIADDDPDIIRFVQISLDLEGYEIFTAGDGEEALREVREHVPDLVLLDIMMPRLDGFEVCRRLRSDPRTAMVSVIMLTAKSLSADKLVGLTAGADDYIIKPFDPVELVARVRSTLRRAREMRDVNPLTGFPGNMAILQELQRHLARSLPFALMHVDLDNFKAFNDYYGFIRGDEAIKVTARVLQEAASAVGGSDWFVGHIGGDDFTVICRAEVAEVVAKEVISRFDAQIRSLYDPKDVERGFITVVDRRQEVHEFPLMTISIGIATNEHRKIKSHWEASEIAGEMKRVAKREPRSTFAVDRRRGEETGA